MEFSLIRTVSAAVSIPSTAYSDDGILSSLRHSGLFGFISNIYVVTVIALYKPMHKQLTNIYITNQSVIDATVAFFLFFTTVTGPVAA